MRRPSSPAPVCGQEVGLRPRLVQRVIPSILIEKSDDESALTALTAVGVTAISAVRPTPVRHVGQPVALVVAETLTAARDAAGAIEVEYDPLPAITEAKDAISPGAPQLFDHIPSNIVQTDFA